MVNIALTMQLEELSIDMPRFARKIISIDYDEFAKDVGDKEFVEKITSSLYGEYLSLEKRIFE